MALLALLAYTYWIPRGPIVNADSHLALTRALVDDHALRIDRYAVGLSDRAGYRGHFYTDKAPGLSFLAVPAYAALRAVLPAAVFTPDRFFLVRYLLTILVIGLPAALFVGLLWRVLAPIAGARWAALLSVGFACGTMACALSALLFSHMVTAMCLFCSFLLLQSHAGAEQREAWWRWAGAGGLCGLAILCEYPAALVAVLLAAFATANARGSGPWPRLQACAVFGGGAVLLLLPLPLYNWAVYGSPLSQGYAHLAGEARFRLGMGRGLEGVGLPDPGALWGLTFGIPHGLFVLSPFLLLAVPGSVVMWRRGERPGVLLCVGAALVMLLFNSGYYFWDGGDALGPRHMTPALPFLLIPAAHALRRRAWRRIAPWLVALSIAICTVGTALLMFALGKLDPSGLLPLARGPHGIAPLSWGALLGAAGLDSLGPLLLAQTLVALALWRSVSRRTRIRKA